MAEKSFPVVGYEGVDHTTDPFMLGKASPSKSVLSYNYRAKNGVRVSRAGWQPIIDYAGGERFYKSGVYFPYGSKAIVPLTTLSLEDTFFCAGTRDFTIELWYRAQYMPHRRVLCKVPVSFGSGGTIYNHMYVAFFTSPYGHVGGDVNVQFVSESSGSFTQESAQTISQNFTLDGEWHHLSIRRSSGLLLVYVDCVEYSTGGGFSTDDLPSVEDFLENQFAPQEYNHLEIGGDEISIAEFRIWNDYRTDSELSASKDISLTGTEDGLVCYVPFDEADGKYFEEKVNSARGYFYPQEPFVNDDNELVFTGYDCLAFPSHRSTFEKDDDLDYETEHTLQNEDAGYDGGIAWDTTIAQWNVSEPYPDGPWSGALQIRFRLRQLKEGVICGRLGLLYDPDSGAEKYRLFFFNHTNGYAHLSNAIVDGTWIGVEKTVTIYFDQEDATFPVTGFNLYVDDSDEFDSVDFAPTWSNGTAVEDTSYIPQMDTTGSDEAAGALGGSINQAPAMCIAFDLIFLRHWYGNINFDSSIAIFVSNTYDQEDLPDKYRYLLKKLIGYFVNGQNYVQMTLPSGFSTSGTSNLRYIRIPLHYRTDSLEMDGSESYLAVDHGSEQLLFKQDVYLRRIGEWDVSGDGTRWQILDSTYSYYISTIFGEAAIFNGADVIGLVNEYNYKTFRDNRIERPIYIESEKEVSADVTIKIKNLILFEAIEDDSPLQGIEKIGGVLYKSRYLQLTGYGSRSLSNYEQRTFRPRWCDGPIKHTAVLAMRGIIRYTSEDGVIDKLLVIAGNVIYELNASTGALTKVDEGWIDLNGNSMPNFVLVNNRLVVMDSKSAIKLNYKGKFSRLGVDRPVNLSLTSDICGHENVDTFQNGEQYAWVVQFVDTENDAKSGTIPVFSAQKQALRIVATSGHGADYFQIAVKGCLDENVDRVRFYRTLDLANTGSESSLHLAKESSIVRVGSFYNYYRDVWTDAVLGVNDNEILSTLYLGVNLVPPNCSAIGQGYGRMLLFSNEDALSTLFWSDVDALGFARPDMFPPTYSMIIEEGGTSKGTAVIEYNSVPFLFKEDAIFRLTQETSVGFGYQLIYKGVGAVNQKSVVVAGNAIIFLDKNGIYVYKEGEPTLLSGGLVDFFANEVDQDNISSSFMLYDKKESLLYAFVPSSGSTYCDRCIVYDLRTGFLSIDIVPDATCGYVDDDTVYIGTAYGRVLKYDSSATTDVLSSSTAHTAQITPMGSNDVARLTGDNFATDGSMIGAPCYVATWDQKKIWSGKVVSVTDADNLTVDDWEPIYGTTDDPVGSFYFYIGMLYLYDKGPYYAFANDQWEKGVKRLEIVTDNISTARIGLYKLSINHGSVTAKEGSLAFSGDRTKLEHFGTLHRNFQFEHLTIVGEQIKIKEIIYHIWWGRSSTDQA